MTGAGVMIFNLILWAGCYCSGERERVLLNFRESKRAPEMTSRFES